MKAKTNIKTRKKKLEKTEGQPIFLDVSNNNKPYIYKIKKICVDFEGIKNIHTMKPPFGHARKVRRGQVNKLYQLLKRGEHFESPLQLEKVNNVGNCNYRNIDGEHRKRGMYKYLEEVEKTNPGSTICFYAGVYEFKEGLTDKEKKKLRREIYRRHNIGTKQSTDDFIASHQDVLPFFDITAGNKRIIPCEIYGKEVLKFGHTLKYKDFVGGYFAGTYKKGEVDGFKGGYSGNAEKFVDDCIKKLTNESIEEIAFVWDTICKTWNLTAPYDFKKKKGQPKTIEQCISKTTPFYAVMRLILDNKNKFTQEELISRLQRDTIKETIKSLSEFGGRSSCKNCHKILHHHINEGYENHPKKQFIPVLTKTEINKEKKDVDNFTSISGIDIIKKSKKQNITIEELDVEEEQLKGKENKKNWSKFKGKYK